MTRWLIISTCAFLIAIGVRGDDPAKPGDKPPVEKPGDADELKKAKKPVTPGAPEGESDEAKILERLTKNTKTAEEKLAGADTGDATRKLQREILKDIDELLKKLQNPPPDSQDSESSSSSSSSQQKPMDGSSSQQKPMAGSSSQPKPSSGQQKSGGMSRREQREQKRQQQAKNAGGSTSAQNTPKPMPGDKPMLGDQPMPGGKDPMANGQDPKNPMGGKPDGKPRSDADARIAEMYKDVWGHLPEKMRQEMDSYFKDRFMPRYNDLLKQYYSTIAEQNKKK